MGEIWEEETKFSYWLKIELAILRARKALGDIKVDIPDNLSDTISIDPEEINRIERESTHHDVAAFLQYISPQIPLHLRPFFHEGVTSYDIGDTTSSLQLVASLEIIRKDLREFMEVVKSLAYEHKNTSQIGRTHGVHAEPITFGVKLANWYSELERREKSLGYIAEEISFGKISGAVGMYTLNPEIEEAVCEDLNLHSVIATQIVARDIISEYMCSLAVLSGVLSKIALNIRLLGQTEIGEVREPFSKNQKGSSAMPHKQNPIYSERVCGMSRIVQANVNAALTTQSDCWYERSLDNSSCERITIPDSSMAIDYMLSLLVRIFSDLRVYPERMMENIGKTHGLIFSQEVMMLIAEKDIPREDVHTLVGRIAFKCDNEGTDFFTALSCDEMVMKLVTLEELKGCFKLENKIKNVNYIFERVFGE